jgi:hypothetical protein
MHTFPLPGTQAPLVQASATVQLFPSLQLVPSAFLGLLQVPVNGSHTPAPKHCEASGQVTGLAPVHTPATQVSTAVHRLASLQVVPFGLVGVEHWPVAGSQVPAVWHWLLAVHATATPAQTMPEQTSFCVHMLLSLHLADTRRASHFPSIPAPAATLQA